MRCEQALGFHWINLDADAERLEDFLKDMIPIMDHYEFGNLAPDAGPNGIDQLQLEGSA
ncbi:MAG: hypothetical protein CM15mP103_09140 [Gammaproteobacteria bacterium]|nr:MAG: hypothetical protein CM15mP103_09140 [Gammaproteobacteria bacterium]